MASEDFIKATKGKSYKILESCDLLYEYGRICIFEDSDRDFYIGIEGQPDRGQPYFDCWKIKEEYYRTYLKPSVTSLKKLLSVKFFDGALFAAFIKKGKNRAIVDQILLESSLPQIKDYSVKVWFARNRRTNLDSKIFKEPKLIGEFELPGLVHATQFRSDNILEIDTLLKKDNRYHIQKYLLDINKKEFSKGRIIDMINGLPFFSFGKDYPIESVLFGVRDEFEARALNGKKNNKIEILKEGEILYKYEYPTIAGLGRFWVFDDKESQAAYRNSLLFMYSIRDVIGQDDYYILRFEVRNDKVIPLTRVLTRGDSIISFSSNGFIIYYSSENGQRSEKIKIVQI